VQEVQLSEVLDHCLLDRPLEGEVELLQRLACGEARGLDPALAAVALAGGDLGGQQRLGEALVAPLLFAGAVGELGSARAAAGALSARNRWASSEALVMPESARRSG
jgi:hypothetical protein